MIKTLFKTETDEHFRSIPDYVPGCWINCEQATLDDIEELSLLLQIDSADLRDALDNNEIPRIERIKDIVIIYCRYPTRRSEFGMYSATVTFVLSKDYFITISPTHNELLQEFIETRAFISTAQKTKILLNLLTKISQSFFSYIRKARAEVLMQEKELKSVSSDDVTGITLQEEKLNQFITAIQPFKQVIEYLTSGRFTVILEKDQDLLEDLIHSINQSEDMCRTNLRMIRSLRNVYEIIFTTQLNKTMKLLTAMTIILNIPTMVASLYGMNVSLPVEKSPFAFYMIIAFITILSFSAFYVFQKRKWL